MLWQDRGIILFLKPHSENNAVLEVFTLNHGRHFGMVRGGRSRRYAASLQTGNSLSLEWHARLDEHLGIFTIEPEKLRAGEIIASAQALYLMQASTALLRLLPERETHPHLFEATEALLDHLHEPLLASKLLLRLELALLDDLGFGLDLSCCVATGTRENLAYVSPRSGCAVSLEAGTPYHDRLFALPRFLLEEEEGALVSVADLQAGFAITEFFLARDVYMPRGIDMPEARFKCVEALGKITLT